VRLNPFRKDTAEVDDVSGVTVAQETAEPAGGRSRKSGPTPTRKEAEEARRQRVNPMLSPREAKRRQRQAQAQERSRAMEAREKTPEKTLLRDWVDSRRNIGEFLLPSLVVLLALQFLSSTLPDMIWISTLAMYLFIAIVIIDITVMWRGFRRLLARKLPNARPKGLLMYGAMRCTQIRRFRVPAPQVERGHTF